jgi:OFA family oxalate/formate antiporter-like MFS transporter
MKHTRAFWNLPVIHGMGCAGHGIVLIFVVDFAVNRGIEFTTAAIILTLINVFSIAGRFLVPIITERIGGKLIMSAALAIQAGSVAILLFAGDVWAFYLFACVFGLGFGGEMSAYPVVNRQYFGTGPVATVYGFQISGAMMGHFISTLVAGIIIQFIGYMPAFILSMTFSSLGVVIIMTLETTKRQLIPDWEEQLPPEARTPAFNAAPAIVPPAAAAAGMAFGSAGGDGN